MDASGFQLDAGRRSGPGELECHDSVTDIMRVVEGNATVVTGDNGAGVTHQLGPGDVLVIPEGVPHGFTSASDPFLYFVVKVES
jgi:mannose-6-phosphate isomerase-like protein (cupin superfamily)